jgi:hypothetical protein
MKRLLNLFLVTLSLSGANAQIGINHTEILDCKIDKVTGRFGSFIPPQVGDTITFDLSAKELTHLDFKQDGNRHPYIPTSTLIKEIPAGKWMSHQAFYLLDNDPVFENSTKVIIGAYGNLSEPLEKRNWAARIQILQADKFLGWSLEQADLSCVLVKP